MRFTVQYALVNETHLDDLAVNRTHDTKWRCRNSATWVAEDQHKHEKQHGGGNREGYIEISQGDEERDGSEKQERKTLTGNKWIASTFQRMGLPALKEPRQSRNLALESIRFLCNTIHICSRIRA